MRMQLAHPKFPNAHANANACSKSDISFNSKSCEKDQQGQVQDWEIELTTIGIKILDELDTQQRAQNWSQLD
jgi:hypothetical protein